MSHFFVVAILPKDTPSADIEPTVATLMAQYDENKEVPAYEEDCYCVGYKAKLAARESAKREVGEFNPPTSSSGKHYFDLGPEEQRAHEDAYAVWEQRYDEAVGHVHAADPAALAPDPGCDECHGSGRVTTTRNPLAKWDWFVVGGRWDGAIQHNRQISADGGFNFGDEHHQVGRNVRVAGELANETEDAPFAIVTPDGSWHERAKMGWFGASHDNRTHSDWETEARGIFAQYAGHMAVGLDAHI